MAKKITVRIVGDALDLRRAFKDAEASSKSFGDRFKKDSETLARLAKRGAQAIGALTAAVVGVSLKGGVERLMGLERANKQLSQLGVATKDADGLMDSLLQTLLGTPFALDKGAASLAGFVASGRDLKDVPRLVQQVTDAAAFGNTTLEEMDFIWQRIQTTGRVTNRELRMLAQRNIPVYTQLAGAIGTTADEVFDMASNGELSADLFFDSWQKAAEGTEEGTVRIAGAAKAMGETTEGAWGNMRTSMSRFGATLLEDVFPLAKDAFNAISEGFDRMGEVVSEAFGNLDTSGLEDFISRIPEMMEDAAESVVEFWQATERLRDVAITAFRGITEVVTNELAVALAGVLLTLRAISRHPLIVAITAVGFAIGTIAERADEAWAELKELRDILEDIEVSGDDAKQAFEDLLTSEQIFMLNQYGLTTDDLARMSLPELEQSLADVRAAQEDSIGTDIEAQHQFQEVFRILQFVIEGRREHAEAIREERNAHFETAEAQHRAEAATAAAGVEIETTTERLERMGEAEEETGDQIDDTTGALERQIEIMQESHDQMRAQVDPLFALRDAQNRAAEAQEAVNEAIEEHGRGSPEHLAALEGQTDALLDLRQANIDVRAAGALTREEFVNQQRELGHTKEDAELLADSLEDLEDFKFSPKILSLSAQMPAADRALFGSAFIPVGHTGGEFRTRTPGGEGLALLQDREQVIPADHNGSGRTGGTVNFNLTVHAGLGANGDDIADTVINAIQQWSRRNGGLAL